METQERIDFFAQKDRRFETTAQFNGQVTALNFSCFQVQHEAVDDPQRDRRGRGRPSQGDGLDRALEVFEGEQYKIHSW